jgi:hypothetical protein
MEQVGGPTINWSGADTAVLKRARAKLMPEAKAMMWAESAKEAKEIAKFVAAVAEGDFKEAGKELLKEGGKMANSALGGAAAMGSRLAVQALAVKAAADAGWAIGSSIREALVDAPFKKEHDEAIKSGERADIFFKTGLSSKQQKQLEKMAEGAKISGKNLERIEELKNKNLEENYTGAIYEHNSAEIEEVRKKNAEEVKQRKVENVAKMIADSSLFQKYNIPTGGRETAIRELQIAAPGTAVTESMIEAKLVEYAVQESEKIDQAVQQAKDEMTALIKDMKRRQDENPSFYSTRKENQRWLNKTAEITLASRGNWSLY